jgi:hypothetical protein
LNLPVTRSPQKKKFVEERKQDNSHAAAGNHSVVIELSVMNHWSDFEFVDMFVQDMVGRT